MNFNQFDEKNIVSISKNNCCSWNHDASEWIIIHLKKKKSK